MIESQPARNWDVGERLPHCNRRRIAGRGSYNKSTAAVDSWINIVDYTGVCLQAECRGMCTSAVASSPLAPSWSGEKQKGHLSLEFACGLQLPCYDMQHVRNPSLLKIQTGPIITPGGGRDNSSQVSYLHDGWRHTYAIRGTKACFQLVGRLRLRCPLSFRGLSAPLCRSSNAAVSRSIPMG